MDTKFLRFSSKLYRQIVGTAMDTNCAPPVADLFLFCYVMKDTSSCLFLTIIMQMLLKHLTLPIDI